MAKVAFLKTDEEVLSSMGVTDWCYEGHGAPSEFRFFELEGDGDVDVLRFVAYDVMKAMNADLSDYVNPVSLVAPGEGHEIFDPLYDVAVLAKSSPDAKLEEIEVCGGPNATYAYGCNPDRWCLLLDRTESIGFDEGMTDKVLEAYEGLGDKDCPHPVPAFDRYDWLTEKGHEIKKKLEEAGFKVTLRLANGESDHVSGFGY